MKIIEIGHKYELPLFDDDSKKAVISFIHKAPDEKGEFVVYEDGITNEQLMEVLINRLSFLQGKMACAENVAALNLIQDALAILNLRTKHRKKQGVEGTNQKRTFEVGNNLGTSFSPFSRNTVVADQDPKEPLIQDGLRANVADLVDEKESLKPAEETERDPRGRTAEFKVGKASHRGKIEDVIKSDGKEIYIISNEKGTWSAAKSAIVNVD